MTIIIYVTVVINYYIFVVGFKAESVQYQEICQKYY